MTNAIHRRILAFALAVATVIAFTPAIAFTQSASAATRPGKVSWASESKTQTTITLNWKKASKASGYSVYQKKSGKYVKVKNTGNRTYTVKKLKASKTYKFYVKAYRTSHGKKIYGKRSSVKTVTTCNKSAAAQWNIGASASGKAFDGSNGSSSVTATLTTKGVIAMKGSGNTVVFSSKNRAPWTVGTYRTKVKSGTIGSNVKPTNMDYWYYKCSNMTSAPELPTAETTAKKAKEVSGNETCVISVAYAWAGTGITVAPQLRNGVVNASFAFSGCRLLATGSDMPSTVNNMNGTYENCSNLTGAIQLNCDDVTSCVDFVSGAATNKDCHLTIDGTSGNGSLMETIKTDNSGNLNIKVIESQTSTPVSALSVKVSYILSDKIISAFSASAQGGTGSYRYQWYVKCSEEATFEKIDNATESTYKIPATGDFPSGAQCKCIVTDFANNTAEATGIYHNGAVVQSWNIGAASAGVNYTGSNGTDSVVATLFNDGGLDVTGSGDTVVFGDENIKTPAHKAPWNSAGKTSAITSSTIASGVTPTNMGRWYEGCAITAAPAIPSSVANMDSTFQGCTSLTTAPDLSGCTNLSNMFHTFSGCTALTTAPTIPSSVTNMTSTFFGCTVLTTAPAIPSSVKYMFCTFYNCGALTGTMQINANPDNYDDCFSYAATRSAGLTVNYTSAVRDIDAIIATGTNIKKAFTYVDVNDKTASSTKTAEFTATPGTSGTYAYQWYKNGTKIDGATSSSYETPTLSASDNGNVYRCVVSNGTSTAYGEGTLTVTP